MASDFAELWILEGISTKLRAQKTKRNIEKIFHQINGLEQRKPKLYLRLEFSYVD
jgi:hypothetical protein